jgi:hypothetical protein
VLASCKIDVLMPWDIVFYKAADESVPTDDFLDACPVKVRAQLLAVLDAVAEAPPPRFSGGGRWEAMHGDMGGYYEVRSQGPKREQFRLFCIGGPTLQTVAEPRPAGPKERPWAIK